MTFRGSTLLRGVALSGLALALTTLLGCGPEAAGAGDDEDADTEAEATSTTATMPMTTAPMTTAGSTAGGGEADAGSDEGTTSDDMDGDADSGRGFIDDAEDDAMPDDGGPQPLGGSCSSGDECDSGFCYDIPTFGGVCSECLMDSDCEMGTCAGDFGLGYAVCTDGALGLMCDSDEGCMGDLVCGELIDTGGFFPLNFCSECNDTTACDGEQICTPVYDLANFEGSLQCADPGSVENGGGCPVGDDTPCMSGFCGTASIMGFVDIGVCGECNVDADCPMPDQTCVGPTAGQANTNPTIYQ